MPNYDERTSRGWPLPHPDNDLEHDVERLRSAIRAIDKALDVIEERARVIAEEHVAPLEDHQNFLETRLDVIAGQTTEDTEILDARVDAESTVHPNLGHNVRNLHSHIINLNAGHQGILKQFNELAEARIQGEINLHSANERRKAEIQQEEIARNSGDTELQGQVNELSEASLQNSLNLQHETEQRRNLDETLKSETTARINEDDKLHKSLTELGENLNNEELARSSDTEALQIQITSLAKAGLDNALNLQEEANLRRERLENEAEIRSKEDKNLQAQVEELAQSELRSTVNLHEAEETRRAEILREEFARNSEDKDLQTQVNELSNVSLQNSLNDAQETEQRRKIERVLEHEHDERIKSENFTQEQIDDVIACLIRNALNEAGSNARRKQEIKQEAQTRLEQDTELQTQIKDNSKSALRNALNIQHEAEERREGFSDVQSQLEEVFAGDEFVQAQILSLINAILRGNVNLHEAFDRFRTALILEAQTRAEHDKAQQSQIDYTAEAGLNNALSIHQKAETRREELSNEAQGRLEQDGVLQAQIDELSLHAVIRSAINFHEALERQRKNLKHEESNDTQDNQNATAILQGNINFHEAHNRRKDALKVEALKRSEDDIALQAQTNENAETNLQLMLNLAHEAKQRRNLEYVVSQIKSPVDWSYSESLAIPEPRCAIVNFTGINAMPTSKTAEIPATMEFWDRQGNYFKKNITCSAQGSSSLGYVKKNVKFDFLDFDLKIGNWVVQDSFHLKAYYTDFFRGVAVTSYKLWDEIMQTKPYVREMVDTSAMRTTADGAGNISDLTLQLDTGALCHPDGFPCIVYLNGQFYGVFSWQIKKQRKNYHMDKSTVEHIHLDGSLYTQYFWNGIINWTTFEIRNPNKLYTMDGKKYDGDAPKELIDETSDKYDATDKDHIRSAKVKRYIQGFVRSFGVLKNLYTAYKSSPSDETLAAVKAKYEELFDWENQRDYLIFSDIVKNSDGFGKNWQWTTYDGVKWHVNAYDLDISYGGHWQGTQITAPLTGHITTSTALPTYYVALLYKSELEARYRELRDAGIIDVEHIATKLEDWTARIGTANYELEYERWPNSPCILNYNDSIYRVRKWLEVEIANMDKVYNYNFEPETGTADSDEQPRQINELAGGLIRSEFNAIDRHNRRKFELRQETHTRSENEAGILKQINSLSVAELQDVVNLLKSLTKSKLKISQETQTRSEHDNSLQFQIDALARANLQNMINDVRTRKKIIADIEEIKQLGQSIESMGSIINSLDNIYKAILNNNSNIATDGEIDEMLDEIFP